MSMLITTVFNIAAGIGLLLLATLVFDVVHFSLHRCASSSHRMLRAAGALHDVHHRFLDTRLCIHRELIAANAWCHVVPEFLVQVTVTCLLGMFFSKEALMVALGIEILVFLLIIKPTPGFDINHHPIDQLKAYRPLYFCVPEYHLLHHVYPRAYFSSWIKTLDHLLGTGVCLQDRTVYITGRDTVFGKRLAEKMQEAGCRLMPADSKSADLHAADILVLCHHPESNDDYQRMVESYCQMHKAAKTPGEIWALSQQDEFSRPASAAYAAFARRLFSAEQVIYRHLVACHTHPDAHAADALLHKIRKGFNYVPERWSAAMLKHYGQFVLK
jgi:hypothetical protein